MEAEFQRAAKATDQARRIESLLRDSFSRAQGVALDSLECRGSTCRAQVTFSSRTTDVQFTRQTFLDPSTRLDLNVGVTIPVRNTRSDGSVAATMFVVAAGTEPG